MTELILSRLDLASSFGNPAVCVSDMVQQLHSNLVWKGSVFKAPGVTGQTWGAILAEVSAAPAPPHPLDSPDGQQNR